MPRDKAFQIVNEKLGSLEPRTLLFLKNIKKVEWKTPTSEGSCTRGSKNDRTHSNSRLGIKRVRLTSQREVVKYLVLERSIKVQGKPLSVEVAFRLDKGKGGGEAIIPEKNSKLVVFFPTERETFLEFVIQGPYVTTPSRENIPLKNEQNQKIIDETGKLVATSLPIIRDLGYLNTNFLSMLPIDSDQTDDIYSVLYDKIRDTLLLGKFLPDLQGGHTTPGKAVLADGRGVTEFLNKSDLNELFSKTTWLNTNITGDRTPELRRYLIDELAVHEINFRDFASEITKEFLNRKSDKWMVDFYGRLLGQRALWNKNGLPHLLLNTKPIMRLDTGEHIEPFNVKRAMQIYLPTATKSSNYSMVKEIFVKNEKSYEFLKELGVKRPDIHAEVREFVIPKYQRSGSIGVEERIEDFEKIFKSYTTIRSDEKVLLRRELLGTRFILSVNGNTGKKYFRKPGEVYFPKDELTEFFKGYESAYFVDGELLRKDKDGAVAKFLRELGVENRPRYDAVNDLTWEETKELRNGRNHTVDDYEDYMFEGLENFFQSEVTPERSHLLWRLLLKSIEGMTYGEAMSFFIGSYSWRYYGWHYTKFETRSLKILRQVKWLIDKKGGFIRPSDITYSERSPDYKEENSNTRVLEEVLFKEEEYISEAQRMDNLVQKALEAGVPKDKVEQAIENLIAKENSEEETWVPAIESSEAVSESAKFEPSEIYNLNLPDHRKDGIEKQGKNHEEDEDEQDELSATDKKEIGEWGEEHIIDVYLPKTYLPQEYQVQGEVEETDTGFKVIEPNGEEIEIEWLNKNGDTGVGYDICIKRRGDEVKYIEVKSTTRAEPRTIDIQGTQWGVAETLFKRGEGEKYSIWVVPNVGNKTRKIIQIDDPVRLWRENKLRAHPVRLKLPKNTQGG